MKINRKLQLVTEEGQVLHHLEPYIAGLLVGTGAMLFVLWGFGLLQ